MGIALAAWLSVFPLVRCSEATSELEQLRARCKELVLNRSRFREAGPIAEQYLALALKLHGELHQETVVALHWIGFLAKEAGRYAEAEQTWQRSIGIQEQFPTRDPIWFSRTLHMLGDLHREQCDFSRAEVLLKRALEVRENALGLEHPEVAQIVRTLGRLHKDCGDYAQAEACFVRVMEAAKKGGPDYESVALATLSQLYIELQDWEKAAPLTTRAMRLNEKRFGLQHSSTADTMEKLATVVHHLGNFAEAESLRLRSLAIRESLNGTNDFSLFGPLVGLGQFYLNAWQLDKAEVYFRRSLDLVNGGLGEMDVKLAWPLAELGRLYECRGDYVKAIGFVEQALLSRELNLGLTHRSSSGTLRQLARLHYLQERPDLALAAAGRIQDGEEQELAQVLSFTSERQRLAYLRGSVRGRFALWATMGATMPLARAAIRSKGIVIDSLLEDRLLAEASEDPQTRQIAAELAQVKRKLAARHTDLIWTAEVAALDPGSTNDLLSLRQKLESLEGSLARKVRSLGNARRALSVQVEQVQTAIPKQTVLLEFLRYRHIQGKGQREDRYGVLLLASQGAPEWIPLGPADAIEKTIKLYQHAVRNRVADGYLAAVLSTLHQQLWAPFAASLPTGTSQIIICPDAQLNFVSFATLLTSSNRFLGEQMLVSYVSSSRDLLNDEEPPRPTAGLFVWANPDFDLVSSVTRGADAPQIDTGPASVRGLRGLNFRPLPGTEKEGRMLGARWKDFGFSQAVLYVGENATEAELKKGRSPDVLHLATHGFVLPESVESGTANEGSSDEQLAVPPSKRTNPMLRCGLALAGARRTLDLWARGESVPSDNDGIVTAEDIAALDLRHTRLVVLSACDTGAGEARAAEGVLGLRRGFIQAGVQNLLLTLWPIDDERTADFMADFHAAAHRTGDFPRALAEVQRAWLEKLRVGAGISEACRFAGPFILNACGRTHSTLTSESVPSYRALR